MNTSPSGDCSKQHFRSAARLCSDIDCTESSADRAEGNLPQSERNEHDSSKAESERHRPIPAAPVDDCT